jgi:curli production assembly/transport component CsgG
VTLAFLKKAAVAAMGAMTLAGCASLETVAEPPTHAPTLQPATAVRRELLYMPPPPAPIAVAVYNYPDQTGQLRASDTVQSLSRAVSQGGTSILVKALQDAGNGNWFTVVERENLDNLLKERQIIREMRQRYLGEAETPANVLPSLLFAGVLLEGGIIGYDNNVETGGIGARYLAIGAAREYRRSTVTVHLRAVSVRTGEVLSSVVTSKTIASVALQSNVFKFVAYDELMEFEAGVTANEPSQIALQQAIEKAVYALILDGANNGLWEFADRTAGQVWLDRYAEEQRRALDAAWDFKGGEELPPVTHASTNAPATPAGGR